MGNRSFAVCGCCPGTLSLQAMHNGESQAPMPIEVWNPKIRRMKDIEPAAKQRNQVRKSKKTQRRRIKRELHKKVLEEVPRVKAGMRFAK